MVHSSLLNNTFKLSFQIIDTYTPRKAVVFLEASHRHFLITPFHGGLQNVKGKVDGFNEL